MLSMNSISFEETLKEPEPEIPNQTGYQFSTLDLSKLTISNSEFLTKFLKKQKMLIFGHSFGSMCSAIITHFHPELVMGLCLIGSGSLSTTPGMRMYTAFGYGVLAPEMSDSEVMEKCKDKEFQVWY